MDNFSFLIQVARCSECPYIEYMSYGPDCRKNNTEWPFYMPNKGKDGVSKDCPFRKKVKK